MLELKEVEVPDIKGDEILIKVSSSGICHTEIDEIEGRAKPPSLPIIPGHQIVGYVYKKAKSVKKFKEGDKVAVGWIGDSCGKCPFCKEGLENLCLKFKATGKEINGGYAEFTKVKADFAYKVESELEDEYIAPLLCAGAVGYRSLKLTRLKDGETLGFTGFGASAHLVLQLSKKMFKESKIVVFARGANERKFALELGANASYKIEEILEEKCDAIIDTTPVWKPLVYALKNLKPNGRLIVNAIRKEDVDKDELLNLDYKENLWLEKEIKSVANVSRKDIEEFLNLAFELKIKPEIEVFSLENALKALLEMKEKKIRGAKVIKF